MLQYTPQLEFPRTESGRRSENIKIATRLLMFEKQTRCHVSFSFLLFAMFYELQVFCYWESVNAVSRLVKAVRRRL